MSNRQSFAVIGAGVIGAALLIFGIVWGTVVFDRFEKVPSDLDRIVDLDIPAKRRFSTTTQGEPGEIDPVADVSRILSDLLRNARLAEEIVPITESELKDLDSMVETIPASKWAVELQPIGYLPALRAPDGRLYNPADGKFYDTEEELLGQ